MSDFTDVLKKMAAQFQTRANTAVVKGAEVYKRNLENAYGSYKLAQHVVLQAGALTTSVLVDKDYASYLEYGNNQDGPYIYPRNGKVLRFIANGGEVVFATKVKTYAGKHIAENTLESSIDEIYGAIIKEMSK